MATSGGVRAGRAFVEAYLDSTQLERGLNRVASRMKTFASGLASVGTSMIAIGGAIMAPAILGAKALMAEEFEIRKMSEVTGMAADSVQTLFLATKRLGLEQGVLATGIAMLTRVTGSAMLGNKAALKTFDQLGVSIRKLAALSPEQRFFAVTKALAGIKDESVRASLSQRLLGRGYKELGDLAGITGAKIESLKVSLRSQGLLLSPRDLEDAKRLRRTWVDMTFALNRLSMTLGSIFTPSLRTAMGMVSGWIVSHRKFIEANRGSIAAVLGLGAAFLGMG
jgi:hypothetical protein